MWTPLQDVKRWDALGLLREAMVQVGPATQTLAAMRRLAHKDSKTFASVAVIADLACLPPRTVEQLRVASLGRRLRLTPRLAHVKGTLRAAFGRC